MYFSRTLIFVGLLAWSESLCALRGQGTNDPTVSSVNATQISNFWNAVRASNGPVTVLAFGDSVSDSYLSIQREVFLRLQRKWGSSGYAFGDAGLAASMQLESGAVWTQP